MVLIAGASWSADCGVARVHFDSKSGDPHADDMAATVHVENTTIAVPLPPATFRPVVVTGFQSACTELVARRLSRTRLLVLVAQDDRPDPPRLVAIMIGTVAAQLVVRDLGHFLPAKLDVLTIPNGLRALLIQGWKKDAASDGVENVLAGWLRVVVDGAQLRSRWEKPLPPSHAEF